MPISSTSRRGRLLRDALFIVAIVAFAIACGAWLWLPNSPVRGAAAMVAAAGFIITLMLDRRARHSLSD